MSAERMVREWRIENGICSSNLGESQSLANYSQGRIQPDTCFFVDKVLLEHSHTHLFMCLWLLLCYKGKRQYSLQDVK